MDSQEKHKQHKEKEREQQKKVDKAHEDETHKNRLPLNPFWWAIGVALTLFVLYVWTVGMWE